MPEPSLQTDLLIELSVLAVALLAARWRFWLERVSLLERYLAPLSERPGLCFAGLTAAAIVVRLALLPISPVPMPLYHDEFSYLLGADTFYHARLTNPLPPAPLALETIHTNMWPTYESMYMPGPALVLTVGWALGCAWISVLLITSTAIGAVYWMVSGWLPRPYALTMGIIALCIAGSLNWWFDNYFCLGLSCLGGALVLGSAPRIVRSRDWRATWPLGCGLVLLMLTRPYEGFCTAFPCVLVLAWKLRTVGGRRFAGLAAFPSGILGLAFVWLLYYNWRGTGHPLLFPYMLNFQQYHISGPFLFSAKKPVPTYHWEMLRRFYTFAELPQYHFMRFHPWLFLAKKIAVYYFWFVLGLGMPLLTGVAYLLQNRRVGLLLAPLLSFCGFVVNVLLMAWAPFPQYAAPAAPLLLLLVAFGFFWMRRSTPLHWEWLSFGRWDGLNLVRGVVLAELMLGFSLFGLRVADSRDFPEPQYVSKDRARVAREVLAHPGKQLCLVRYTPGHDGWQEWVFNNANPRNAPLVWARSGDPEMDRQTIAAFPGRQVWLVTPDDANRLVAPYPK